MATVTGATKKEHDQQFMEQRGQVAPVDEPEIKYNKDKTFVSANYEGGLVGGNIKDNALHISHAELDEKKQGKGYGKKMYKALIDHAHSKGHKVFSDITVEMPAVKVYESLRKDGYFVNRLEGGGELPADEDLPHGALYGRGVKNPVFEVLPKSK